MDTSKLKDITDKLITVISYGKNHNLYASDEGMQWIVNGLDKTVQMIQTGDVKPDLAKIKKNLEEISQYGQAHFLYDINAGITYVVNGVKEPLQAIDDMISKGEPPAKDYDMPLEATPPFGDDGSFKVIPEPTKDTPDEEE